MLFLLITKLNYSLERISCLYTFVILCFLVWCFLLSVSIHVVLVSIGYFLCLVLALLTVCPFLVSWLLSPIFHFSPVWPSYSGLSTFTVVFLSFVMISLYVCVQSFPFGFWDFKFQFSLPLEHFFVSANKSSLWNPPWLSHVCVWSSIWHILKVLSNVQQMYNCYFCI